MEQRTQRRGRRRQRSEDAGHGSTGATAAAAPVVSAAEAAATLEFLDELGEFLELDQQPCHAGAPAPAAAIEPIPFEPERGSAYSLPASVHDGFAELPSGGDNDEDGDGDVVVRHAKKKKKSSTQRQKEELAYLRSKVGQLERELKNMKTAFLGGASVHQESEDADGDASEPADETRGMTRRAPSMWETMAQGQLKEKNRAQQENAKLRGAVETQIKLAKGLERMLRKRKIWDEMQECSPFTDVVDHEAEIYALMTKSIEARIPTIDAMFEHPTRFGARGASGYNKIEANTVHSESEGLHIEFIDARTIPFDFRATARMTWKFMGTKNPKLKAATVHTLLMEQTEESLTTKHLVTTLTTGEKRTTTTRSEYRRIFREDAVVMVWHSIMENKGEPESGKPGILITQQGCSKIMRAEMKDGSVATTFLSFMRMTPKIATAEGTETPASSLLCGTSAAGSTAGDLRLQSRAQDAGGVFTEVMIASYLQNVQTVRQAIENDLMDEFLEEQRTQCEIVSL